MIDILRRNKYLTAGLLHDVLPPREVSDKRAFYTFLSEVPADFMSFIKSRAKTTRVRQHLKSVYHREPKSEEVEIVVRRLVSLALAATHRREEIENRPLQSQYKNDNWSRIARCQVCGLKFAGADAATVDHILPISLGGEDRENNWELLCRLCNDQKARHFGCCDIGRASMILDAQFFSMSVSEQLKKLSSPHMALRYELFERAGRGCAYCKRRSSEIKLYVYIVSCDRMVNADNLSVCCDHCLQRSKGTAKQRLP